MISHNLLHQLIFIFCVFDIKCCVFHRQQAELSTWDESGNSGGWLDEDLVVDDINEDQIIREARQQRRNERKQKIQNKTEKHSKKKLASKLN